MRRRAFETRISDRPKPRATRRMPQDPVPTGGVPALRSAAGRAFPGTHTGRAGALRRSCELARAPHVLLLHLPGNKLVRSNGDATTFFRIAAGIAHSER